MQTARPGPARTVRASRNDRNLDGRFTRSPFPSQSRVPSHPAEGGPVTAFSYQLKPDARPGPARLRGRLREAGRETLTKMSRTGNDSLPASCRPSGGGQGAGLLLVAAHAHKTAATQGLSTGHSWQVLPDWADREAVPGNTRQRPCVWTLSRIGGTVDLRRDRQTNRRGEDDRTGPRTLVLGACVLCLFYATGRLGSHLNCQPVGLLDSHRTARPGNRPVRDDRTCCAPGRSGVPPDPFGGRDTRRTQRSAPTSFRTAVAGVFLCGNAAAQQGGCRCAK